MSRALDFLVKARPQAMGAYFQFLKDNGSRLEPKTRALISVITKVATETEAGLVQYTRRAFEAGASSEEILDALLMAFPALGLTRIVWAVDVLIEHGFEVSARPPIRRRRCRSTRRRGRRSRSARCRPCPNARW